MAQDLVASLVLTMKDQLGGGLAKLTEQLDKMRGVADQVQLRGLNNAAETLNGVAGAANRTNGMLARMQTLARETGAAFTNMGRMAGAGFKTAWEEAQKFPGKLKAFGEAGSNLIGAGFGAAAEAYAVVEPVHAYADRDKLLRSIAIMEHKEGPALTAEIGRLGALVNADAYRNALSGESVAEAYKDLLGQGLPAAAIDNIIGAHSAAARAYGIPPDILGPVTGALAGNLKIAPNETDTGAALAAIASASQGGRFKMVDFSHTLPGLTGVSASLGMTGRGALNTLAAGLEIATKTAVDPTQAGVNFQDLLGYITSNREDNLARKKLGLDMPALLEKAAAQGVNPFDAYLNEIKKLTAGKSPLQQAEAISHLVTNQQARLALLALIQHNDEFEKLRKSLAGINAEKLKMDHDSAMAGPEAVTAQLSETLTQLNLVLGQAFFPILQVVGKGLHGINVGLTWLNTNFPKTTSWVLLAMGSFLALGAVLTVIGAVVPLMVTGFNLLIAPLKIVRLAAMGLFDALKYGLFVLEYFTGITAGAVGIIAGLALVLTGAAIDIYEGWDRFRGFFVSMWQGIKDVCRGVVDFFAGIFTGDMTRAEKGIERAFSGLKEFFGGLFGIIKQLFVDFGSFIDHWTGGVAGKVAHAVADALHPSTPALAALNSTERAAFGGKWGYAIPPASSSPIAGAPGVSGTVNVHVSADPGVKVAAASSSPGIRVSTPNSGATVTRP